MVIREKELNENLPSSKGMRIVGIIDKFEYKKYLEGFGLSTWKNDVRHDLEDTPKTLGKFVSAIKNGTYKPKIHMGPTISLNGSLHADGNPMYDLETGWHRTNSHDMADEDTMYVVVVEFYDFEGHSASYWKDVWKALENKENTEIIKNTRKNVDLAGKIVSMVKTTKTIKVTDEDLIEVLDDMGATEAEVNKVLPLVYEKLGHVDKIAKPLSEKMRNTILANIRKKYNGTVKKITFEKGEIEDYEARNLLKWMKSVVADISVLSTSSHYIAYFNSGKVSEHETLRKKKGGGKKNALSDAYDLVEKVGLAINKAKKEGVYKSPTLSYFPTLTGESEEYEKSGKLPTK